MCLAHGRTQNNMREWLSWWSTTLPRSGPRVRVPSRALIKLYIADVFRIGNTKTCASGSVGGARPCQGRGRGFESRLALSFNKKGIRWMSFFVKSSPAGPGRSRSTLRSGRRRADVHWTSCAVSRSAVESLGNFWLINHWSKKSSLIQTRQIRRWI